MRGTKLWVDTGSPLIRGRSRRDRPFLPDLLIGIAVGWVSGGFVASVMFANADDPVTVSAAPNVAGWSLLGAALGSLTGMIVARMVGWRRRWIAAAALGAAVAAALPLIALGRFALGGF